METETIVLTRVLDRMDRVELINKNGDTYTSKSEELMNFLHDANSVIEPVKGEEVENLLKALVNKLEGVKQVHSNYHMEGEARGVESAIRAVKYFLTNEWTLSSPVQSESVQEKGEELDIESVYGEWYKRKSINSKTPTFQIWFKAQGFKITKEKI